jgi:hypothetical protein
MKNKKKTNKKLNYLFVLDRSGSMNCVRQQTINNVNEQFNVIRTESKKNGIESKVTLLLFDQNGYDQEKWFDFVILDKNVDSVEDITEKTYKPNGGTPLLDAIGVGIEKLQEVLGDTVGDSNRKLLVNIFTDGEENASTRFDNDEIKKRISHLSEDGKWTFAFLGCGGLQDVQKVSANLGILRSNTLAYADGIEGHMEASRGLIASTAMYMSKLANDEDTSLNYFSQEEEPVDKK